MNSLGPAHLYTGWRHWVCSFTSFYGKTNGFDCKSSSPVALFQKLVSQTGCRGTSKRHFLGVLWKSSLLCSSRTLSLLSKTTAMLMPFFCPQKLNLRGAVIVKIQSGQDNIFFQENGYSIYRVFQLKSWNFKWL